MPSRASSPPMSSRAELAVGGVLAVGGGVVLATRVTEIPGFVAELVIGFVEVAGFWTMVGASVAVALGIALVLRGRRGIREHRRALARLELLRERRLQRAPRGGGVSAGVGGTPHRAATGFGARR